MEPGRTRKPGGSGTGTNDSVQSAGVGVGKQTLTQGLRGVGKGAVGKGAEDQATETGKGGEDKGAEDKPAEQKAEQKPDDKQDDKKNDAKPGSAGDGEAGELGDATKKDAAPGEGTLPVAAGPKVTHETKDTAESAPNTRTKVGVGETITFKSDVSGTWTADAASAKTKKKATGDKYVWVAMSTKGTAKIKLDTGKKGDTPFEISIEVIEPTVDYKNAKAAPIEGENPGEAGVNMRTDIKYGPTDVSFDNTMWWEKPGPGSSPRGYFKATKLRRVALPDHKPFEDDIPMNSNPYDTAGFFGITPPFREEGAFDGGGFEWSIPTYYKVVGDTGRHLIKNVHQICDLSGDGTVTVTKESGKLSRPLGG